MADTRSSGVKGPDELRRQFEEIKTQLGDAVAGLAAKADMKGRAQARAADLRDKAGAMTVQLRSSAGQAGDVGRRHPGPALVAGAAGVVVAAGLLRHRRNGRRRRCQGAS